MDKIIISNKLQDDLHSRENRLKEIRAYIETNSGFKLHSIRFSKDSIIAKAANNYEAIEIRMKMQKYLEENNIKIL